MTVGLERFEQIIEAYGANPRHWPEQERAAAEHLVAHSEAARAMLASAAELDAWLDAAPDPVPSDLLAHRVLKAAPRPNRTFGWASGAGWAAAAAAGLVLGLSWGQQVQLTNQAYDALDQATTWSVDEAEYFG
ncbi:hypothetical protein [Brevundimonas aveniformis]|uniref:hypothetical protein n=1 Tax=Brevundimonas aveniformis TaxID=370977 RepID=UPI002491D78F|nr:hypothetical protein [Brevundimonas aveniformis]